MNDEVFIVGGGPSLKGFDFSRLAHKDTIAVNVSALDVPNPTYSITADSITFRKLQKGYFKNVNTTWVVVSNPDHCTMKYRGGQFKNIKTGFVYNPFTPNILIRNAGVEGIGFSFKDFRTGYNSGFCALQLAVLLRYQRIYLLGFDLHPGEGHYHDRYKSGGGDDSRAAFDRFYNNFALGLKLIAEKTDIKVYSCSRNSRLNDVIPFVSFDVAIKQINVIKPTFEPVIETIVEPIIEPTVKPTVDEQTKIPEVNPISMDMVDTQNNELPDEPDEPEGPIQNITDNNPKVLSILICHLHKRKKQLQNLLNILNIQRVNDVEILIETDDGEMSIGEKRNKLLRLSKGGYVAFIDDDDTVSPDYVKKILDAVKTKPDCCSLEGEIYFKSKDIRNKFVHSMDYYKWEKQKSIYVRCPNHLNPIRRDLAIQIGFKEISVGEDLDFSMRLRRILRTEVKINGTIYFYETR